MVRLTSGTYQIGSPLKIGDNTHFLMDQDVTLVRNFGPDFGATAQATLVNADGPAGNTNIRVSGGAITTLGEDDDYTGKHLGFDNVKYLSIDDVRILRTWKSWAAYFRDCHDVTISNLVIGDAETDDDQLTDDGLHFSGGSRIVVDNCVIYVGDDCIALSNEDYDDGHNLTDLTYFAATNCTLTSVRAHPIRILVGVYEEPEEARAIRYVRFSNIVAKAGVGLGNDVTSSGIRIEDRSTDARRVSDIAIDGMTLDCSENTTSATFGYCLVVIRVDRLQLTGVRMLSPARGATIDDGFDVELRDVEIDNPRESGQNCLTVAGSAECASIRIMGGLYRRAKQHGINLGGGSTGVTQFQVCDAQIEEAATYGLLVYNAIRGLVSNNFIRNCGDRGIYEVSPSDENLFVGNFMQGIGINTAFEYQGSVTEAVRNIAVGKTVEDSGGFRQTIDGWVNADALQVNQSNVELARNTFVTGTAADPAGRFRAARSGSITGIVVTSTGAGSTGTLTVTAYINNSGNAGAAGSSTGFSATLVGSQTVASNTQRIDADQFSAGHEIYLVMTTSGWSATSENIRCAVEIED